MNARHVALIALYSSRYSVRSGIGLVFLLAALLFGLMVSHMLLQPAEKIVKKARAEGVELTTERVVERLKDSPQVRSAVDWILGSQAASEIADDQARRSAQEKVRAWTAYLLDERPALLSTILLILFWGWPFVASLGAFDLFSGDVQSRGIRYHLMRADRSSIYFGRVLGAALAQGAVLLFLVGLITTFLHFKLPFYGFGAMARWGGYGALMMILVSLPYLALCGWISGAIDSPFGSLTIITVVLGGVPLLAVFGEMRWEQLGWIRYLLPWGVQLNLFQPSPVQVAGAAAACLGYTAVFLYLGHRHFQKRDL
ncbi:MAG: ABC transporter permease subunit [Planctomycetes bacterium]|nr:ABC transporter permease subunit [Planctomycetota bacterium]MCB9888693.1 ABC transporter permease subunit [Planctomycetota bacterium]